MHMKLKIIIYQSILLQSDLNLQKAWFPLVFARLTSFEKANSCPTTKIPNPVDVRSSKAQVKTLEYINMNAR